MLVGLTDGDGRVEKGVEMSLDAADTSVRATIFMKFRGGKVQCKRVEKAGWW